MLVSADYLASDYLYEVEAMTARARARALATRALFLCCSTPAR